MAAKKKSSESVVETRSVSYLPAGVGVDPYQGEPTLDPELAKIRDAEIKTNDAVEIESVRPDPTIDDALVKARDAEIKRDAERSGTAPRSAARSSSKK